MTDPTDHGAPLRVVATIPVDPARSAEAAPALAALAEASRGDAGCLEYEAFESAATPGLFVTVEAWRSQADLDAHMQQPHVAAAIEVAGPLLVGEIAIHPLTDL